VIIARLKPEGGDIVLDRHGHAKMVLRSTRILAEERSMVRLIIEANGVRYTFQATSDHPVTVGSAEKEWDMEMGQLASAFHDGSPPFVVTGIGLQPIVDCVCFREYEELFEVVFEDNAHVRAWTPARRLRGRSLSPQASVVCRGARLNLEDCLQAVDVGVQNTFLGNRTQTVLRRSISSGDLPASCRSEGSQKHDVTKPEDCEVCLQHFRHLRNPALPECRDGNRCKKCHMPHFERANA